MVVDTIHISAVVIALLRFGTFARSLCAIVSCSVMERGTSEWLKKIKRCPKQKMEW